MLCLPLNAETSAGVKNPFIEALGLTLKGIQPVEIEMALDRGEVLMTDHNASLKRTSVFAHPSSQAGGQHSEPLCEMELELKSGDRQDGVSSMYFLAMEISSIAAIRLCEVSKAERGYRLLDGEYYLQSIRELANQYNKIPHQEPSWAAVIEESFATFLRTWECGENAPKSEFLRLSFLHITRLTCLISILKAASQDEVKQQQTQVALEAAQYLSGFVIRQIAHVEVAQKSGETVSRDALKQTLLKFERECGQHLLALGYWIYLEQIQPTAIDIKCSLLSQQWRDQVRDALVSLGSSDLPTLAQSTRVLCLLVAPKWHESWAGLPEQLRPQISELFQKVYGAALLDAKNQTPGHASESDGFDFSADMMIKHWLQVLNGR